MGCCDDPARANEGPPTGVLVASQGRYLDADNPRPCSWECISATHDPQVATVTGGQRTAATDITRKERNVGLGEMFTF